MDDIDTPRIVRIAEPESAVDHIRRMGRRVVTFSGFSGAGYEDSAALRDILSRALATLDPASTLVCSGATDAGIGAVYPLARAAGFDTIGIVSSMAEKEGVAFSRAVQTVYLIDDDTWGGYIDDTTMLSPTSRAMVGASDALICVGGGSIARDEYEVAKREGKPVQFTAAEMNRALAIEKAARKGLAEPCEFGGLLDAYLSAR